MTQPDRPCVSIVIPCYNHEKFLRTTVECVQAQTFADWECIIVNDGSTDSCEKIALTLAAEDSRIRYIYQENRGPSAAMNRGIDEALGRYIMLIGADDLMEPEKLALQVQMLSGTDDLRLCYCDFYWCDTDGNHVDPGFGERHWFDESKPLEDIILNWVSQIIIHPACFLLDARIFKEHGIRHSENIDGDCDYDLWTQVFALRPRCFHLDEKLVGYRIVPGSVSKNLRKMRESYFRIIAEREIAFANDKQILALLKQKRRIVKRVHWVQAAPIYELVWWTYRIRKGIGWFLPASLKRRLRGRQRSF